MQAGGKANYVEVYLPHTDTWRQVTCMNENHFGHKSCSVAGRIYVFGGFKKINLEWFDADKLLQRLD